MILTIDQGTTSSRALVISPEGKILSLAQKEFQQIYPQAGWVEHDANEIWDSSLEVCQEAISKVDAEKITGIAITNQRETTVLWDKRNGEPIHNAIVWQCRRTSDYCQELRQDRDFAEHIRKSTGLLIDSYFSGPKLAWLLKDQAQKVSEIGIENLAFGTIDSWLLWKLTEGRSHYTEPSNASRTMLYDIKANKWDQKILDKIKIPSEILPTVIPSNGDFGGTDLFKASTGKALPIKAMLGDQQAAWYAHKEAAKITYGTGAFVLLPNADCSEAEGLVTSIGYQKDSLSYITEGSVFVAGAIVQWLRDELGFIEKSSEIEELARSVEGSEGLYLIPALVGLGAPHWKENARGAIFGISRGSNRGHIARAALEGIAFSVRDVFDKLKDKPKKINVDGGASKNDLLMQFQADLLGVEIHRFNEAEMTALGVARMTGMLDYEMEPEKIFKPQENLDHRYQEWQKYLNLVLQS